MDALLYCSMYRQTVKVAQVSYVLRHCVVVATVTLLALVLVTNLNLM